MDGCSQSRVKLMSDSGCKHPLGKTAHCSLVNSMHDLANGGSKTLEQLTPPRLRSRGCPKILGWSRQDVHRLSLKEDVRGFKPIAEQVIDGPLTELKMTAAAFTFDPGGYVGPHLHAGPGWRCVTSGEVTNIEADGKSTVYGAGQCYWESGLKSHTPRKRGQAGHRDSY
jgi:hypothetical protein